MDQKGLKYMKKGGFRPKYLFFAQFFSGILGRKNDNYEVCLEVIINPVPGGYTTGRVYRAALAAKASCI